MVILSAARHIAEVFQVSLFFIQLAEMLCILESRQYRKLAFYLRDVVHTTIPVQQAITTKLSVDSWNFFQKRHESQSAA